MLAVTASLTISGLKVSALVAPGPDPYTQLLLWHLLQLKISKTMDAPVPVSSREASSQPPAPQQKAPPSLGPQPCNHPGSPSPHCHTASDSTREAHSFPANHLVPTPPALSGQQPLSPCTEPWRPNLLTFSPVLSPSQNPKVSRPSALSSTSPSQGSLPAQEPAQA